jgi:hypothetical protein
MLAKQFTYVADDAEEDRTTWQRNGVQPAGMEKQLLLRDILGELEHLIENEYANILLVHSTMRIAF